MNLKFKFMQYTLSELTTNLDVAITIQGDANYYIAGVATIKQAKPSDITFLTNATYKKFLAETQAGAVILKPAEAAHCKTNAIITANPHYVYARIAEHFNPAPSIVPGIHPTACVSPKAHIDPTAAIGPYCVIEAGAQIGADSVLDAHVTVHHGVRIGKRTHIASGVVIGSDGFGFANQAGKWYKVAQIGSVIIGDDVDIGANTTIDRGAIEDTVIEEGVKLDNLIQIAHNVRIGAHTVIAGCVGVSGSTTIGKHCMIGGASCIAGHVNICDGVIMTGLTTVTKSINKPGLYSSGIVGAVPNREFLKHNARFNRLEQLMERVKKLEKKGERDEH